MRANESNSNSRSMAIAVEEQLEMKRLKSARAHYTIAEWEKQVNMHTAHNGRVCANMSALIIITISIWLVSGKWAQEIMLMCRSLDTLCRGWIRNWGVRKPITVNDQSRQCIFLSKKDKNWKLPIETGNSFSFSRPLAPSLLVEDNSSPVCVCVYALINGNVYESLVKDAEHCKPIYFWIKRKRATIMNGIDATLKICIFFHFFFLHQSDFLLCCWFSKKWTQVGR